MNRAIIFVGRLDGKESYQLLIGEKYFHSAYSEASGNRDDFLEEIGEQFADRMLEEREVLEVGIMDGYIILDGELKRIDRLEDKSLEGKLSAIISHQLNGKAMAIPISNN